MVAANGEDRGYAAVSPWWKSGERVRHL